MKLTVLYSCLCLLLFSACSKNDSLPNQQAKFSLPDYPKVILRSNCVLGQSPYCQPNVYKFMVDTSTRSIRIEEDTVSHNIFSLFQYDADWRLDYFFYRNSVGGGDTIHFLRSAANTIELRSSVFNRVFKKIRIEELSQGRTVVKVDDLSTDPGD